MKYSIQIPKPVKNIMNILEKAGYDTYIVGGCVRDSLLGKQPKDWDITTQAEPSKVVSIFKKYDYKIIDLAKKHGTIILIKDSIHYEVTTFRKEGKYLDNRRPSEVFFTKKIQEDLDRRDFTINAMCYSTKDGLIDFNNGVRDLEHKIIRAVGVSRRRISEDSLRILRGIRFSSQLGFEIDEELEEAMVWGKDLIKFLSMDRIREELNKILLSNKPSIGLRNLKKYGLLEKIIPEIKSTYEFDQKSPHHDKDIFEHTLGVVDAVEGNIILRLSALLHDIGKPQSFSLDEQNIGHFYNHHKISASLARVILKRLNYSNVIIKKVCILVKEHMVVYSEKFSDKAVKKLINRIKPLDYEMLIKLQLADVSATKKPDQNQHIYSLATRINKINNKKEPMTINDLAITGDDILEQGIEQGPDVGLILKYLLEKVLEDPSINTKKQLINLITDKINDTP